MHWSGPQEEGSILPRAVAPDRYAGVHSDRSGTSAAWSRPRHAPCVGLDRRAVAFARGGLEPLAREHADRSAAVADQRALVQRACRDRHRAAEHAEMVRELPVRELEIIRFGAIVRHQQAARET